MYASVDDRVTLLREISSGPVSALFAAERRRGAEAWLVAVKLVRRRRARDLEQISRLRHSGRKLHRLGHPNICAVIDLAAIEGQPALISPWVEGMDLLDWLEVLREAQSALPVRAACEILKSAAAALDAATGRVAWGEREPLSLMHRDVKPSNLMISRDGEVKLLDFGTGLTTLAGRDARQIAMDAGVGRYLSPGRRTGKRGSQASDIYALGLIGIEILSGRWLQRTKDANPAHDRHLAEVVASLPSLELHSPQDDRALRSLLLRMVAFDPEARPPASEVTQTLRTLVDRCPGPCLQTFAQERPLAWLTPPEPQDGLPEGLVVEPDALPSLVREAPEEPFPDLPAALLEPGTEESVWEPRAAALAGLDDSATPVPLPSITPIRAVPSPNPAPPRQATPAPLTREKKPSVAAPVVAGAVGTMVVAVGGLALGAGVALGVVLGMMF